MNYETIENHLFQCAQYHWKTTTETHIASPLVYMATPLVPIMTPWHGDTFRIVSPSWRETTGQQWISGRNISQWRDLIQTRCSTNDGGHSCDYAILDKYDDKTVFVLLSGNLAYLKPATQGPGQWQDHGASLAVDGNVDQALGHHSCAHPNHHPHYTGGVWWQVDLLQLDVIFAVNITNRIDFQGN